MTFWPSGVQVSGVGAPSANRRRSKPCLDFLFGTHHLTEVQMYMRMVNREQGIGNIQLVVVSTCILHNGHASEAKAKVS